MKVFISAGHSNSDPGACANGMKESELVTDMRNYVVHYLKAVPIEVVTDGKGKTNLPLREAIKIAKESDLSIEFHFNASSNTDAKGVEVLAKEKDKQLSQDIAKAIVSVTGTKTRGNDGYRPEDSGQHSRLGFVEAGGLIVEIEFLTCKDAMEIYLAKKWLVAKAIADVIINYIEEHI